ncbi:hypothetical protein SRB17_61110 [Streptomyces sp. RB17]|nr:hypothetical protein [Streptomyces sp. RB17]
MCGKFTRLQGKSGPTNRHKSRIKPAHFGYFLSGVRNEYRAPDRSHRERVPQLYRAQSHRIASSASLTEEAIR